jgi:hypothetical protein
MLSVVRTFLSQLLLRLIEQNDMFFLRTEHKYTVLLRPQKNSFDGCVSETNLRVVLRQRNIKNTAFGKSCFKPNFSSKGFYHAFHHR